ncbi:MAG: hypothetical protein AB7J28_15920 [Hyphomonadaceae bacterium]
MTDTPARLAELVRSLFEQQGLVGHCTITIRDPETNEYIRVRAEAGEPVASLHARLREALAA